ncbi:MAG: hypothetical protein U9P72_10925 [Campylobacterota bacterium]|nr:hypothetical protein [Campylobacterota bacterium]
MLNTDDYEILKNSFIDSQRLFNKLNVVANNVENMEFDESGLYQEDEEMYERHWLKLSSKIVDALDESLDGYGIELLKNDSLELRELTFNLIKDDVMSETGPLGEKSKIKVDYSEDGSLNILQIS